MKLCNKFFITSGIIFGFFVIFTALVMFVDVKAVGFDGSKIGLADFNKQFFDAFGSNHALKVVSDVLGYLSIVLALSFVCVFVCQWITRKSLKKIDKKLYALMVFYVIVGIIYVLFLFVVINYRPTALESSYPSSHALLFCSICLSSMFYLTYFTKNAKLVKILQIVLVIVCVFGILCRLFCGVHWITDIIGAILLSGALAFALLGTNYFFIEKNMVQQEETKGAEEKAPLKEIEAKE